MKVFKYAFLVALSMIAIGSTAEFAKRIFASSQPPPPPSRTYASELPKDFYNWLLKAKKDGDLKCAKITNKEDPSLDGTYCVDYIKDRQ